MRIDEFTTPDGFIGKADRTLFLFVGFDISVATVSPPISSFNYIMSDTGVLYNPCRALAQKYNKLIDTMRG